MQYHAHSCMLSVSENEATIHVLSLSCFVICCLFVQVEEALIRRKKQELLERYASDALQTQVEESKKLVGL